ncbi:hypothetical protein [Nocardioides aurantiacus]|uniref:Lipoprotein n=1 Tax=Nocardioides aurantiacus TaxID=86796 RepID=A0A3N2CYH2_9ACTN|nr:hypothetical protein [Nocardioides aurantiacus]ROR92582.1 hypothetical protein EDD33_3473 [Nocardioides aurantiacus]
MRGVRRTAAAAAGLTVLALAGCADGSADDPTTARGQVQLLTAALVEADATALKELVVEESLAVSDELLVDDVLEQGALARRDVRIEADGDLAYVKYTLDTDPPDERGGEWLRVDVRKSGGFVGSVLPTVELTGRGVTALRVGDVEVPVDPVPAEGRRYHLPPGDLTVAAVGPEGLVTHGPGERIDTRDVRPYPFDLGGELTAAGEAQVQRAVRSFVRRCTRPLGDEARPRGCPARLAWVGGLSSSTWTLAGPVRATTEPDGAGWRITTPRPPLARMAGQVRDPDSGALLPVTDRVRFRVQGSVVAKGDRLEVAIPGY